MSNQTQTPKKASDGSKAFSTDFVTYLYAACLKSAGGKLAVDYKHMSALSKNQFTPSSIEHQLRDIKKRAAQLNKDLAEEKSRSDLTSATDKTPTPPSSTKKRSNTEMWQESPLSAKTSKRTKVESDDTSEARLAKSELSEE